MSNEPSSGAAPSPRTARRFRISAVIILAAGLAAAGLVYWSGTRNTDTNDDLSMQGFNRAEQRQMGQLYGKSGLLLDELENDLKQPGTQAIIIAVVAALIAGGCFYLARLMDDEQTP